MKSRILPMSDDRVHTFVKLKGRAALPFQEYFVRGRARGVVENIELRGSDQARHRRPPCSTPSNRRPRSSSHRRIPSSRSVRSSLSPACVRRSRAVRHRVAAISPIVGGKTIKGPADKMMRGLGHEVSPLGIARLYQRCRSPMVIDSSRPSLPRTDSRARHERDRHRHCYDHAAIMPRAWQTW